MTTHIIDLITSFYLSKNKQRQSEIIECLNKNITSNNIQTIHLFLDDNNCLEFLKQIYTKQLKNGKIKIVSIGKQPLYSDYFNYANSLVNKVCAIMNSDIWLHSISDLSIFNNMENKLYGITRHENDLRPHLIDRYTQGPGFIGSQDAFIFKAPVKENIINNVKFPQNIWGSDNVLLREFQKEGYQLENPCRQIIIIHEHASGDRGDERKRLPPPWVSLKPSFINSTKNSDKSDKSETFKFIFDEENNFHKTISNEVDNEFKNFKHTAEFFLDNGIIQTLKTNRREHYRLFAENYNTSKKLFEIEKYNNDYITLNNSYVSSEGIIQTSKKELYVNGGCKCETPRFSFEEDNSLQFDSVISISALWCEGIWHFPYESFVSLMAIPKDILTTSKIHITKKTNYVSKWLEYLNIPSSQVITGNVYANTLYLPRMGKCGQPYYSQIKWLKNIINENNSLLKQDNSKEYIILVKRNYKRCLKNYDSLELLLDTFCKKNNFEFYIHDDSNLPSLQEQQKIFSNAKIVFAPHGAAGINIITMKETSLYVEFLSVENVNLCYSRLSYLNNVNYKGISMYNSTVDLEKINQILFTFKLNNSNIFLNLIDSNNYITEKIKTSEPFIISKMEIDHETEFLYNVLTNKNITNNIVQKLNDNSGIYLGSTNHENLLGMFATLYLNSLQNSCALTYTDIVNKNEVSFIINKFNINSLIDSRSIEPFYLMEKGEILWTHHLNGKKVLIINPLANIMKNQRDGGFKLFGDKDIFLEDQEIIFYKSYNTTAGNNIHRHWYETFLIMCKEIKDIEFDIALVSCGGFGILICDYIKTKMNKSAICIGEKLPLFFGIKEKNIEKYGTQLVEPSKN